MKEKINQAPQEITEVNVQRLTRSQLEVMGHKNTIPEGEVRIVALGRNEEGVVIRTEIIEGVDEKDFLHGGEECFEDLYREQDGRYAADHHRCTGPEGGDRGGCLRVDRNYHKIPNYDDIDC